MMLSVLWYSSVDSMVSNLPGEWFSICLLVISLIFLILTLMFMISKIFSVPTLDRKIKEEFFQLGATVIIIFLLAGISSSGSFLNNNQSFEDTLSSMSGYYILGYSGAGVNTFEMSYVYLVSALDCVRIDFKNSVDFVNQRETWLYLNAGVTLIQTQIPIPMRTIFVGLGVWDEILNEYVKAEENMWLSIAGYFQINLLQWIEASMFAVYLPLGILLRSIPFTRGGGAALMGIAITTYIFYPFFLSLFFFNGPQLPYTCSVDFVFEEAEQEPSKKCPLDPTAVVSLIEEDESSNAESKPNIPVLDVSGMNRIRMYTFYYPFLAMLVCIIVARTITQILGGNISDIGRGMVRVI
jgi:hypothetical protein